MNSLLHLKGTFEQAPRRSEMGSPELPTNTSVKVAHLRELRNNLLEQKKFWEKENIFTGALVSIYYKKIAAKSNRIRSLLSKGNIKSNNTIVGARFTKNENKHIITHYVQINIIDESILRLDSSIDILEKSFNGEIFHPINEKIKEKNIDFSAEKIAKTIFLQTIVDTNFVEKIGTFMDEDELKENAIITIFKTDNKATEILKKIGIDLPQASVIDETTILLKPDDLIILKQKAAYLIAMGVSDLSELDSGSFDFKNNNILTIPNPTTEPIIGVIDTLFEKNVYFSKWVEYHDMVSDEIPKVSSDYIHGTSVSSIIVDGPSSNPNMDDGCGRFRVRHFGVATGKQFSSFSIIKQIIEIITRNRDIKVWNLSLGSKLEINKNFISPEAAILDKIQIENDILFVISGTNKNTNDSQPMRVGAPADSINSLVVNSVSFDKKPSSYSRSGPVLSFFTKPDISYYGGDDQTRIRVCTPTGEAFVSGTSYAAPWISRKMSYLIDVLGLTREVAKALIVHSSTGWLKAEISSSLIGHGIVPIKIEDIVKVPSDEIQFFLSGVSEKFDTYNYHIPVPINKDKHPFIAKLTLCYFPSCSRNQGVDYTNTELDISFGRINKSKIKTIDNNYQHSEAEHFIYEKDARKRLRKWDNIKHIREIIKKKNGNKKVYEPSGNWGVSLKTTERLDEKHGVGIKFGIIVTFKEIYGVNRIDDFIRNCNFRGWIVNKIDIKAKIDLYNVAEETISFDDM
jgi:hypothetical protein